MEKQQASKEFMKDMENQVATPYEVFINEAIKNLQLYIKPKSIHLCHMPMFSNSKKQKHLATVTTLYFIYMILD